MSHRHLWKKFLHCWYINNKNLFTPRLFPLFIPSHCCYVSIKKAHLSRLLKRGQQPGGVNSKITGSLTIERTRLGAEAMRHDDGNDVDDDDDDETDFLLEWDWQAERWACLMMMMRCQNELYTSSSSLYYIIIKAKANFSKNFTSHHSYYIFIFFPSFLHNKFLFLSLPSSSIPMNVHLKLIYAEPIPHTFSNATNWYGTSKNVIEFHQYFPPVY